MAVVMPFYPTPVLAARRRQSGAFDLPSVLVGVAVVAILAVGVMAAVFGVIPWAQDRAAMQDLAAVNTSQGTAYAHAGAFKDGQTLVDSGWLGKGTPEALETKTDSAGTCYVAVTTSKTGHRFVVSSNKPAPRELKAADRWCSGAPIITDTAPVMITTWNTGLAPSCQEITLPVTGFKGTVDWGDGTRNTNTTHPFAASGPIQIRIDGIFSSWGGADWADTGCLVSVDRWGATGTTNLSYAFQGAVGLKRVAAIPATTTNLSYAFQGATSNFTIGTFDTSKVTTMTSMFNRAWSFNQPLGFDTSSVTDLSFMFYEAASFNQPVEFDTSKATTMNRMFYTAKSFNHPLDFDTSKVTDMNRMFYSALKFNQPLNFDTSKVTDMQLMFNEARAFNQPLNWDTSQVTLMNLMFASAISFDQPLNWDTSSVTSMHRMFSNTDVFNQPLAFNTAAVTDMSYVFAGAAVFNQDLSSWNVGQVTSHAGFSDTGVWTLPKPAWTK